MTKRAELPERLTAFEFIAATEEPQIVRLLERDVVLIEFVVVNWCGFIARPGSGGVIFRFMEQSELVIEGQGLGHPYWNDETPPWATQFDPRSEMRRIAAIRAAAIRELNRASLSLM